MNAATSAQDVLRMHTAQASKREVLRSFYYSKRARKESQTNYWMNKKIQDRMAVEERRFISGRKKPLKSVPNTVVMCIGSAGTAVGARIKGHAKRGGKTIRHRHGRYLPVAMTNEFRTSQTCCFCFNPIIHPAQRKLVKDEWKKVTNKGTSICVNPECTAFKAGRAAQNRDVQAAACIAIAGATTLLTGKPLACFDNTSEKCTGQHRIPTVTHPLDAGLVTVSTVIP